MRDETLMFILLTHLLIDTAQHSSPWVPRTELRLESFLGSQIRMNSAGAGVGGGPKNRGGSAQGRECGPESGLWPTGP